VHGSRAADEVAKHGVGKPENMVKEDGMYDIMNEPSRNKRILQADRQKQGIVIAKR
jgi:hypothetical protein